MDVNFVEGFLTWQTPISFMAGVGFQHVCSSYIRDRKVPMFTKKPDGTYRFSTRFWVVAVISATLISLIGLSTQRTADRTDALSAETRAYAEQTNGCLADVVDVINTRNGYNEAIYRLDDRRNQVDLQRQAIWEQLVTDLAAADNDRGLNLEALNRFQVANAEVKKTQAQIIEDQAKLRQERRETSYPKCPQTLAGK